MAPLLLAACASPPPRPAGAGELVISGRFVLRYAELESERKEQFHGHFDWVRGRDDSTELTLTDPLGQAVARIASRPGRATITLRDGKSYNGPNPESLTRQALGWPLPVSNLRFWLLGAPGPNATVERDATGRVASLREDGWRVRYTRDDPAPGTGPAAAPATASPAATDRATALTAPDLPVRIDLAFPGPPAEIDLRLALDRSP